MSDSRRSVRLLAAREIRETLRSRAFQVITGLIVLGVVLVNVLPTLLASGPRTFEVVVGPAVTEADRSIIESAAAVLESDSLLLDADDRAEAELLVSEGDADIAYVDGELVIRDPLEAGNIGVTTQFVLLLSRSLGLQTELVSRGLEPDEALEAQTAPPVEIVALEPGGASDDDREIAFFGAVGVLVLLQGFSSLIAQAVAEEKENRLVEVLMISTRPRDVLAGKIVGNFVIALGQATLLILAASLSQMALGSGAPLDAIESKTFMAAALWFLLGYAIYAPIMGAAAALVERRRDLGSVVFPVNVFLMAGYIIGAIGSAGSNRTLGIVAAYFPFTAPTAAPGVMAIGELAGGLLYGAIAVSAATGVGMWFLASTIYGRAVTETGRRVKIREVLRPAD